MDFLYKIHSSYLYLLYLYCINMEKLTLNAELRAKEDTTKSLKHSKQLAWVVYWKHQESILLKLDYSEFLRTFRKSWASNIINLKIWKDNIEVLVHDFQQHPVVGDYIHVDFYAITRWEKLTTNITLNFINKSPAVKQGAVLEEHIKELEVKCLPKNLVNSFDVDLSSLEEFGDYIRISDLNIDLEKFELYNDIEDLVVTAAKPRKVSEEDSEESSEETTWEEEEEETK